MHRITIRGIATAVALMGLVALAGCEESGPMERAGEELDEAVEDVRNGEETLGNRVDDAVDEARDGLNDAKKKLTGE